MKDFPFKIAPGNTLNNHMFLKIHNPNVLISLIICDKIKYIICEPRQSPSCFAMCLALKCHFDSRLHLNRLESEQERRERVQRDKLAELVVS